MNEDNVFTGTPVPVSENWLATGQETTVDCETACWLRMVVAPIFQQAVSWSGLQTALADKGYRLALLQSRLVLTDALSERPICTSRFLGASLGQLSDRLGRPRVHIDGKVAA